MSWANYYRAQLPAPASPSDALAAARHLVATCARPPIDLEARWTVRGSRELARYAERVRAIEPPGERSVELDLLSFDPQPLLELLGRCTDEVQLVVGGSERSRDLSLALTLERRGSGSGLEVGVEVGVEGGLARASDEVRGAVASRLRECQERGVLPIAEAPARIVERFLAAAARDDAHRALAQGVGEDGYRLVCRSWRGTEPMVLAIVPERSVALDPASVALLWSEPGLWLRGHLHGRESVATAASMARLARVEADADPGLGELEIAVRGEPELDALLEVGSEDPIVVEWRCAFDGWGRAYHGVRLALHGRYQDGRVHPEPARHEVIVLVDAKRREPGADEIAALLAARAGLTLERAGSGL